MTDEVPFHAYETIKFRDLTEAGHFCTGLLDILDAILRGSSTNVAAYAEYFEHQVERLAERGHPPGRLFALDVMAKRLRLDDPATRFTVIDGGAGSDETPE